MNSLTLKTYRCTQKDCRSPTRTLDIKISSFEAIGIISKLKHFFPSSVLLKLYYALFHSNILYGLLIWHSTYSTYTNKISRLQNKAIKLIANSKRTDKCAPIYEKLKILQLHDLHIHETATFMYKFHNNKLPVSFSQYFNRVAAIHSVHTRSRAGHRTRIWCSAQRTSAPSGGEFRTPHLRSIFGIWCSAPSIPLLRTII